MNDEQRLFQSAFERSAIGMALVALDGRWLRVNQRLCALLDYSSSELQTLTFQDITHPDDLEKDLKQMARVLAGEISSYELEKRYIRSNGSILWGLLDVSLVRGDHDEPLYFVSQVQDVGGRKRVEQARRHHEAVKAAIVETSLDAIVIIDHEGLVQEWNPAAELIFGWTRREMMGACLHDHIVPIESRAAYRAGMARLLAMGEGLVLGKRLELPALHANGHRLLVELAIVPIPGEHPPLFAGHLRDISARKRGQEALRRQAELLDLSNDAIFVRDAEGRISFWNSGATELYGWSEEEALGHLSHELLATHFPLPMEAILDQLRTHGRWNGELSHLCRDGSRVTVASRWATQKNKNGDLEDILEVNTDITEQQISQTALRASEARTARITDNVPGMVYQFKLHLDGSFSFPFVSEGSREIYGLEPEQICTDPSLVISRVHPDDNEEFLLSIERSAETLSPWRWEGRFIGPDETWKWLQAASRPQREPNGEVMWDGVLVDISKRKAAEEELRRAKQEAEVANEAKSEFLSRMSHELRTPLNAILGFGDLLEMAHLGPDDAQSVEQIVKAGRHLLHLINEVLDIARIEAGHLPLSLEPVSLWQIVRETFDLMRPLAACAQVQLEIPATLENAGFIHADPQRFKQVLLNLLSNAIKYNRRGGSVTLVCTEDENNHMRLGVRDTGRGLSGEQIKRLFTPFERLGADALGVEGSGVGLALCKKLVEGMDGRIGVDSMPEEGSTFWVAFPRADDPFDSALLLDVETDANTRWVVLYIEANLSNLQLLQRLLANRPAVRILTAMHGGLGLELARQHRPNIVLLDLNLSDGDGEDILHALRAAPETRDIPVVVLSADSTPGQIEYLRAVGAYDCLPKPIAVRPFLRLIDDITRREALLATSF